MNALTKVPFKTGFYSNITIAALLFLFTTQYSISAWIMTIHVRGFGMLFGVYDGNRTVVPPQMLMWVVVSIVIAAIVISFFKKHTKYRNITIFGGVSILMQFIQINAMSGVDLAYMPFLLMFLTAAGSAHSWSHWLAAKKSETK